MQYGFVLGSFAVLRPVDSRVWYGASSRAELKRLWNGRIGIRVVLTFSAARSLRASTVVHGRYHRGFRFTVMIWQPTIAKLVRKSRSAQSDAECIFSISRTTPRINNCEIIVFFSQRSAIEMQFLLRTSIQQFTADDSISLRSERNTDRHATSHTKIEKKKQEGINSNRLDVNRIRNTFLRRSVKLPLVADGQ